MSSFQSWECVLFFFSYHTLSKELRQGSSPQCYEMVSSFSSAGAGEGFATGIVVMGQFSDLLGRHH